MKRAFTLTEVLVVVVILAIIAAFLWPIFKRGSFIAHPSTCQSNLKQLGLCFIQYTQDAGDKFPPTRGTASSGWADLLQPYCRSTPLFQCEQANRGPVAAFTTDYFYNGRLPRVSQGNIKNLALTILSGDGDDNASPWNSWTQLPADAATNSDSPSQRHVGGANYLLADGHVKWYKPGDISSTSAVPTSRPAFTFR